MPCGCGKNLKEGISESPGIEDVINKYRKLYRKRNQMDKYKVLKEVFGYDEFRDGQEELVESTLQGRDVLGIMPTGAGKSICFQVPALI